MASDRQGPPEASSARSRWVAVALLPCLAMGSIQAGRALAGDGGATTIGGWALSGALSMAPLLVTSVLSAAGAAALFAWLMGRPRIPGAATAGLIFGLTLAPQTPVIIAAVAMVFGLIVGREVFGGPPKSFVHPAVLAHVFVLLTWPDALGAAAQWWPGPAAVSEGSTLLLLGPAVGGIGASSTWAIAIGGAVLLARRMIGWRILVAVPIGVAVGVAVFGSGGSGASVPFYAHLVFGGLSFGAVFLATDPGAAPSTLSGRWFHGALFGFLVVLFRATDPARPDGTMSALLIAAMLAPLVDHVVRAGRAHWAGAHHV